MLDSLFRRGNPTNSWTRSTGLKLSADLTQPTLNGITIGSQIDKLSFFGRSTSNPKTPLDFHDLGLSIDHENDGSFSGFQLIFADSDAESFWEYAGEILVEGSRVELGEIEANLCEPYWVDNDEDENETIVFYEYPKHEIQIEKSSANKIERVIITNRPVLAKAEQREHYGVSKPWPPA